MLELTHVAGNTYYIDHFSKIGVYHCGDGDVWLIDAGDSEKTGLDILKCMDAYNFTVRGIVITHAHIDHMGGADVIANKTGCKIICSRMDRALIENIDLEVPVLYGGYLPSALRNKFMTAKPVIPSDDCENYMPKGLKKIDLCGHYFTMIGVVTDDSVAFVSDSVFSKENLERHHILYTYDVGEFIKTLDKLKTVDEKIFIPSHAQVTKDLSELANINIRHVKKYIADVLSFATEPVTFEQVLQKMILKYSIKFNMRQYLMVGNSIKAYLSYLYECGALDCKFEDGQMLWYAIGRDVNI